MWVALREEAVLLPLGPGFRRLLVPFTGCRENRFLGERGTWWLFRPGNWHSQPKKESPRSALGCCSSSSYGGDLLQPPRG